MTLHPACSIRVNGETVALDTSGAVWWPAEKVLVVADLHFEKGSAFARRGQFLPPYDTRTTVKRLDALLDRFGPERVIALGDTFHDREADQRLDAEERAGLMALGNKASFIWVEGNHDPDPPSWLGGTVSREIAIGGLVFRHIPVDAPGEVAGHLHPAVRVSRNGFSTRARCFVSDGHKLLLPAFGAFTGGLDVRERSIAKLFPGTPALYACGRDRVYTVGGGPQALARKNSVDNQPSAIAISTVKKP